MQAVCPRGSIQGGAGEGRRAPSRCRQGCSACGCGRTVRCVRAGVEERVPLNIARAGYPIAGLKTTKQRHHMHPNLAAPACASVVCRMVVSRGQGKGICTQKVCSGGIKAPHPQGGRSSSYRTSSLSLAAPKQHTQARGQPPNGIEIEPPLPVQQRQQCAIRKI